MAEQSLGFDTLVEVARHSLSHASGLPAQIEMRKYWSGIAFQAMGTRIAVDLNDVVETLEVPMITKLPGVQSWLLGVANVRGRLLPVTDLSQLLGGPRTSLRGARILVVEKGDLFAGLLVEQVFGIKHFPEEELLEGNNVAAEVAAFTQGHFMLDGVEWNLCSVDHLIAESRFMQAAKQAV